MNSELIIYPTDFSDCAQNAIAYVIAMGKALNGKIRIVHAVEISSLASAEENSDLLLSAIQLLKEEAENKLKKLKEKIESFNLQCEYDIVKGRTLFLKDYIQNLDPLMVVMGTVGKHGFENRVFGSLAAQTIRNPKSIVLVIPQKAKFNNFSEIIFATDFHIKDRTCLKFIKKITAYYRSDLRVIHICKKFEDLKHEKEQFLHLEKEVTKVISSRNLRFEFLHGKDAEDKLVDLIDSSKPDMLALITRKRNFIERIFEKSLSKKMVNNTNVPVLVFS